MLQILISLAIYLPFQLALNPTEGIDLASIRVLIIILFFFWLASGLKNKNLRIKNNWTTGLLISFLFLNFISLFVAKNMDFSLRKILFLFSIFPIYFVVTQVVKNEEKVVKISKALVLGGTIAALVGIGQFLLQFVLGREKTYQLWADYAIVPFLGKSFSAAVLANPSWLVNIGGATYLRATSIFPDPHMLSFYVGMLIPLALGLIFIAKNKGWPLAAFITLTLCDALTFSRGGYLGILAGIVFLLIFLWRKIGIKYKIAVLALISLMALIFIIPNPLANRFYSIFNLKEGSNQGRLETWNRALEVVKNNPLTGVGIGNYPLEIKPTAAYREPIYAHNTYLDIAAETGIGNALVWMALLLVVGVRLYKKSQKNIFWLAITGSLIIFSVHSLVETAIYSPVVLTLFLLLVSFSNVETNHEN